MTKPSTFWRTLFSRPTTRPCTCFWIRRPPAATHCASRLKPHWLRRPAWSRAGKQDEALEFLKGQPQPVLRSPRVQSSLAALEEERSQALFRTLGRAYAGLGIDLPAGEAVMRRAVAASVHSRSSAPMGEAFHAQRTGLCRPGRRRSHPECQEPASRSQPRCRRPGPPDRLRHVDYASTEIRPEWQTRRERPRRPA